MKSKKNEWEWHKNTTQVNSNYNFPNPGKEIFRIGNFKRCPVTSSKQVFSTGFQGQNVNITRQNSHKTR